MFEMRQGVVDVDLSSQFEPCCREFQIMVGIDGVGLWEENAGQRNF